MAGAGYKLFQTGDVLTAAQVNTYLNEQTVMVFADSAARTTALSGVLAEGMMSYLQDTNSVEVYNGTSWVNVGNAGDITEVQAGVGISIASGTGPIPVITNSSTDLITTAGDILYGTAADTVARLGIGTAGQVLKVNSGATAPEWGAAGGASGLTLIQRSTFTNVANTGTTFDGVFSSTYKSYLVVLEYVHGASATDDLHLQMRHGTTTITAGYYGGNGYAQSSTSTFGHIANNNASEYTLSPDVGSNQNSGVAGHLTFTNVGNSSVWASWQGVVSNNWNNYSHFVAGQVASAQTYTSFLLKSSSSNITGIVSVYGLAAA